MAETVFRGPAYSAGSMLDGRVEIMDGPGLEYQANGFPDIRFSPTRKDGMYAGRVQAFLNSPFCVVADGIPQAVAVAGLSVAAAVTAATPITLIAAQANGSGGGLPTSSPGLTVQNRLTGALVTATAMDFGFTTGTTTAGSTTLPVNDGTQFYIGQWIAIGGAGNAGKTIPLIAQVIAISVNNLTLSTAPLAAVTNAPIGNMSPPGPLGPNNPWPLSGSAQAPVSVYPYSVGGLGIFLNPPEALARCVSITGNAGSTAQNFTVRGLDVFGFPMTEVIAFAGGAVTTFGKKAFKYVISITPATTDAGHLLSAGWGDTFGLHVRSDKWEYTNLFYNGAFQTTSAGWTAAVTTNPATGVTGDVRGTLQVSANGAGSAIAAPAATNGAIRLTMALTVPIYNNLYGTPINTVPMFGVTQFAG